MWNHVTLQNSCKRAETNKICEETGWIVFVLLLNEPDVLGREESGSGVTEQSFIPMYVIPPFLICYISICFPVIDFTECFELTGVQMVLHKWVNICLGIPALGTPKYIDKYKTWECILSSVKPGTICNDILVFKTSWYCVIFCMHE